MEPLDQEPSELDSALLYIRRIERRLVARDERIRQLEDRESRAWGVVAERDRVIDRLKEHVTPYTLKFLGLGEDD